MITNDRDLEVIATYSLELIAPKRRPAWSTQGNLKTQIVGLSEKLLSETAENMNDLLPNGYKVVFVKEEES